DGLREGPRPAPRRPDRPRRNVEMPNEELWRHVARECPRRILGALHCCGDYRHGTAARYPGKILCCHKSAPLPEGWRPTEAQRRGARGSGVGAASRAAPWGQGAARLAAPTETAHALKGSREKLLSAANPVLQGANTLVARPPVSGRALMSEPPAAPTEPDPP